MKPQLALALPHSGHYIVAVSGGVDSVTLLHMLVHQPEHDLRLRIAHINHGLRVDSDSDERFVRQLAKIYGLPFHGINLNLGSATEAESRLRRYRYLTELMTQHQARGIITAHHGDDQLETSVFNTLRGSGRHGQAAALKRSQILRPLLPLSKLDLRDYAKSHGLVWREDSTNRDLGIDRNFIRHELLADRPGYSDRHRSLMDQQANINGRLDSRLQKLYYDYRTNAGLELPRRWLAAETWPALASLMHFALRTLAPDQEFSRGRIEELVRLAKTAPAGTQIGLTNRLKLRVGYDTVAIVAEAPASAPLLSRELIPHTSLSYGPLRLSYGPARQPRLATITLPSAPYFIRSVRRGDRIKLPVGTKKIHDIFIDKKVPRDRRQQWPLVVNAADQIMWLPLLAMDPSLAQTTEGYHLNVEER